jgi:hypothetical protein
VAQDLLHGSYQGMGQNLQRTCRSRQSCVLVFTGSTQHPSSRVDAMQSQ